MCLINYKNSNAIFPFCTFLYWHLQQIRDDRKIKDYFTHISNNEKNDLTCKIIIELRDKKYLDKKDNKLKDNEIDELKQENNSLFAELNYFKNKFIRLIKFIKNRLFNRKDRDKYRDFSRDLYEHGVIEDDTIKELNETYKFSKEHELDKEKDDYNIEI